MKKELVFELAKVVRELQPNAMLCSRIGHGMGDYASKGDMEVPPVNIQGLWETCDTNNDSWSYAWYDTNFKSPKEILNRIVSKVTRGGTYLFSYNSDVKGAESKSISWMEKFGEWKHVTQISKYTEGSSASWAINVLQPGYYYLDLYYKGKGKLVWNISTDETDEGVVVQNQQAATE